MKHIIKTKVLLIAMLLIFVSTSCEKTLNIDTGDYLVESNNYYATEKDMDAALRGVYSIMANMYSDYLQGRMGLEADEGYTAFNFDANTVTYYMASQNDTKILGYWRTFYNGINLLNSLLENIDKPDIEDTKRADIKGQALFLRGYFYFMLVNKFGGVPLILTSTKYGSEEELQVPRSSIKQVYDQVLLDMTTAEGLVKDVTEITGGGQISKSAVWGVLARVNLYMAGEPLKDESKYMDARDWAQKVIDTQHHSLNPSYQQVFINYAQDLYDTGESIWEAEFWGNGTGIYNKSGGKVGLNNGIYNTEDTDLGVSLGLVHPTRWLNDSYDASDLRKDWNIPNFKYSGNPAQRVNEAAIWYRYVGKYRRESETLRPKSTAVSSQNAPILRYSDVLLMYAEAINEYNQGPTADAFNAINQVRRRGFGLDIATADPNVDVSANANYLDFKQAIMDERAYELCFEGLRKNDLIRWGVLYPNIRSAFQSRPSGGSLVAQATLSVYSNVGTRDVFWPIPSYEMNLNKKLVQNPGW